MDAGTIFSLILIGGVLSLPYFIHRRQVSREGDKKGGGSGGCCH